MDPGKGQFADLTRLVGFTNLTHLVGSHARTPTAQTVQLMPPKAGLRQEHPGAQRGGLKGKTIKLTLN